MSLVIGRLSPGFAWAPWGMPPYAAPSSSFFGGPATPFDTVAFSPAAAMSLSPLAFNAQPVNFPGAFPGSVPSAGTGLAAFPGAFSDPSLDAAGALLDSVAGAGNWLDQFAQNAGQSAGQPTGNGGQTATSGGRAPLTVNAWARRNGNKQIPVTHIDIQEVGNFANSAGRYFGSTFGEQSETLYTARANKRYYVTVSWADGSTYTNTVADSGGGRSLTVTQPN